MYTFFLLLAAVASCELHWWFKALN